MPKREHLTSAVRRHRDNKQIVIRMDAQLRADLYKAVDESCGTMREYICNVLREHFNNA